MFDLIYSLSGAADESANADHTSSRSPEHVVTPASLPKQEPPRSDLGNFDKIWTFLGQPLYLEPPEVPLPPQNHVQPNGNEKSSLQLTVTKGVRWRDETEGGELADNEEAEDNLAFLGLTKTQRKKLRRKQRKAASEERGRVGTPAINSSETESEAELRTPRRSPDRRSIIQQILHGSIRARPDEDLVNGKSKSRPLLPIDPGAWPVANPHLASPPSRARKSAEGAALAAAAVRKEKLMRSLREQFVEDRAFLTGFSMVPSSLTDNTGKQEGIHVFVDASNIMIGFHDTLKLSRGLTLQSRLRRQPFSFHNLSLILERGRPVSKRVLVGSDNYASVQEAKLIGYEINILDRVLKAKELTPQQKRYSSVGNGTSGGSGSETPVYAKEKYVEQAVDEILHLKIMLSIVDAKEPSTMVVATGDAAEAEYSEGFLRMVERALEKGWTVELVSFRKNTSGMYKRREFRARWKNKFKTIELDGFVEELLGYEA